MGWVAQIDLRSHSPLPPDGFSLRRRYWVWRRAQFDTLRLHLVKLAANRIMAFARVVGTIHCPAGDFCKKSAKRGL
jgi:hypothetical protein